MSTLCFAICKLHYFPYFYTFANFGLPDNYIILPSMGYQKIENWPYNLGCLPLK